MDLKEIKVLTKQARAALREKEYKTALKHCKEILKLDKLNYNAWVFIGVSAQEIEQPVQAEAAFRKAIEISPDQLLAWQGLCQFYEKNDGKEYKEKLIGTYIETLKLMKDDKNKQLEVIKKLWEIYIQLDKAKQCLDIVQARIEAANGNALEKNNCWFDTLKILENQKELSQEEKILLRRCYNELIQSESVERKELNLDVFKNYLQLLRKENEYDKIVSVLKTYMKNYSESDQVLEHYCVTAVEMFIEREIIMEETFEIANSLRLKTASPIVFLALGIVADLKREYSDAIDLYKSCLSANEKCISGYFLLTRTFLKIYKYSEAKSAALTGLKLELSSKSSVTVNIRNMLHLYLAEALAGQHIWKQALQFLDKAMAKLGRTQKCLESLCKIYLKMNEIDKAKELCAELRTNGECLQTLQLDAAIHIFENDYKEAEHKLQKAIGLKYEGSTLYLLGLLYWNTSRTKESFDYFMKVIILERENYII
ncbi:tetratricopeptide repeat protein 37-like [Centruroides sculpturatus]|uniref:tetratricopeptide repeat protein 37-like n=1 Tax=Centruroides sculpturatus TaxID=218467 RepID=UPI000C6CC198|nr:tetratricopeptide repeat protein 37-like [Centruroides sculpturatus]